MQKVNQQIADRARRMRAFGVPMDLAEFERTLIVRQQGGSIASLYMSGGDKPTYWCEISSYLVIILNRKAPLVINDVGLTLPWGSATLLPLPSEFPPRIIKFPGYSASQFDRSQVIEFTGKCLRQGEPLEGFLLAFEEGPIPEEFRDTDVVHVVLTLVDEFDECYSTKLSLRVNRESERVSRPPRQRTRKPLFDCPDK